MEKDQHELYEYARKRIAQKKQLLYHFVFFILGSCFLFVANKWLSLYSDKNWWPWAVAVWGFGFIFHTINVFVIKRFMDKDWERQQIDKLIKKQSDKINELDKNNSNPESNL